MTHLLTLHIRLAALALAIVLPVQIARAQCVGYIAVDSRIDNRDLGVLFTNCSAVTSDSRHYIGLQIQIKVSGET